MHKIINILGYLSFLLALSVPSFARADANCNSLTTDCEEVGHWQLSVGVGAGVRTNPVVDTTNIPLFLIPQISYSGEHFFIQNLDMGFVLAETEQHQINIFITPSYDPVFFYKNHPNNYFLDTNGYSLGNTKASAATGNGTPVFIQNNAEGNPEVVTPVAWRDLHKRKTAGLAGLEYSLTTNIFDMQLQFVRDVTGIHDGEEARVTFAKHWQKGNHRLNLALGANWQSGEAINYYYGVSAQETDAANTYIAASGVSTLVRFDWNYKISEHWDLRFLASYRRLPTAISASPIVDDNKVITTFVGGVYHF